MGGVMRSVEWRSEHVVILSAEHYAYLQQIARRSRLQGHSKNPAGDDGDGFGAVFAEVFARLAHGQPTGADQE